MDRARNIALPLLLLTLLAAPAAPARAGDTLVVLNKEGASAWLIDPATGGARARVPVGDGPHEAVVSPDGRTAVIAGHGDGREVFVVNRGLDHVAVVDMESWEVVRRLPAGKGPDGMAWSRLPD